MHKILRASILSANWLCLGAEAQAMLEAGIDGLHIDVMDYHFVPNLTIGPQICQALRQQFPLANLDIHLMTQVSDPLIHDFAKAGASLIYLHPESTLHLHRSLNYIRSLGCQAGIVLNPSTTLEVLRYIADMVSSVLIMTVNPGFAGQKFIESMFSKLQDLWQWRQQQGLNFHIAVDGGVNLDNLRQIAQSGADVFIAGSALFQGDYRQTVANFRKILGNI